MTLLQRFSDQPLAEMLTRDIIDELSRLREEHGLLYDRPIEQRAVELREWALRREIALRNSRITRARDAEIMTIRVTIREAFLAGIRCADNGWMPEDDRTMAADRYVEYLRDPAP